jgi:hypothetical protein
MTIFRSNGIGQSGCVALPPSATRFEVRFVRGARGILTHVNAWVYPLGDNAAMKPNRSRSGRSEKEDDMSRWTGIGSVAAGRACVQTKRKG